MTDNVPDHRPELFGAGDCEEAPFWVSVENPEGGQREESEALAIVKSFWGADPEIEWEVGRVPMYVYGDGYGGLRVNREPREGALGPFDFWKVDWQ